MTRVLYPNPAPAPASVPDDRHPVSDMADLLHLAFAGWLTGGAGAGLEALFDRMETVR